MKPRINLSDTIKPSTAKALQTVTRTTNSGDIITHVFAPDGRMYKEITRRPNSTVISDFRTGKETVRKPDSTNFYSGESTPSGQVLSTFHENGVTISELSSNKGVTGSLTSVTKPYPSKIEKGVFLRLQELLGKFIKK